MKKKNCSLPKIIICHREITILSTIGQDILGMYKLLSLMRFHVVIAGEKIDSEISDIYQTQLTKNMSFNDYDILIYHHHDSWSHGHNILNHFTGSIIVKYHGHIPAYFFESYSYVLENQAEQNVEQIHAMARSLPVNLWLTNSEFTKQELLKQKLCDSKVCVVPLFNKIQVKSRKMLQQGQIKRILFAGDFSPQSGHKNLINIIHEFTKRFDEEIELLLVGPLDPELHGYFAEITRTAHNLKIENNVKFVTNVSSNDLDDFYELADLFLCMSEGESFNLAILRAQSCGLPVITTKNGALSEIMGDLPVWPLPINDHYIFYATLINEVLGNSKYYRTLTQCGINNVSNQFLNHHIERKFVKAIYPVLKEYI
ncbi:MAG: glycosyltransferase [Gammaproteobacteria bacterium]|nr:glycosyltransferase [Gammaproteobacteria bacterium]